MFDRSQNITPLLYYFILLNAIFGHNIVDYLLFLSNSIYITLILWITSSNTGWERYFFITVRLFYVVVLIANYLCDEDLNYKQEIWKTIKLHFYSGYFTFFNLK